MYVSRIEVQKLPRKPQEEGVDERLVRECIAGSEQAWTELVDRYKNLIFSIPLKYGFTREDAADIFQDVCIGLLANLGNIKDPKALPKWLMQVTSHRCFHWRNKMKRTEGQSVGDDAAEPQIPPQMLEMVHQAEQEQIVRDVISRMPERCQRLVKMLFLEDPPRPYKEVAADLGVSIGSIGLFRHRCIEQLRKALIEIGVLSIEKP